MPNESQQSMKMRLLRRNDASVSFRAKAELRFLARSDMVTRVDNTLAIDAHRAFVDLAPRVLVRR